MSCKSDYQEWINFFNKYEVGFEKQAGDEHNGSASGNSLMLEARASKNVDGYAGFTLAVEFNEGQSFKRLFIFE